MINVRVSNNATRKTINCDVNTTLLEAFSAANIDPANGAVAVNGRGVINTDATFANLGVADNTEVLLSVTAKLANA